MLAAPALVELVAPPRSTARRERRRARAACWRGLGRGFGWRAPRGLEARIAAAGLDRPVADVMAVKAGAALAALIAAVALLPVAPGRLGLLVLAAAPAAGFLAPDAALARRDPAANARDRGRAGRTCSTCSASPSPPGSHRAARSPRSAAAIPACSAHELARAAAHAAFGVPRPDALAQLERRAPAAGVPALVAALQRADRHGAPLAPTLAAEARTARARAAQRAAEQAARAAPQIQLVVALLLVPGGAAARGRRAAARDRPYLRPTAKRARPSP